MLSDLGAKIRKKTQYRKEKWTKKDNIHPGDKYVVGEDDVYFEAVYKDVGVVRTIHIDSNGGEGDAQVFEVLDKTNFVLPDNFYTKENHIFKMGIKVDNRISCPL